MSDLLVTRALMVHLDKRGEPEVRLGLEDALVLIRRQRLDRVKGMATACSSVATPGSRAVAAVVVGSTRRNGSSSGLSRSRSGFLHFDVASVGLRCRLDFYGNGISNLGSCLLEDGNAQYDHDPVEKDAVQNKAK
jgi:hypothetical protein